MIEYVHPYKKGETFLISHPRWICRVLLAKRTAEQPTTLVIFLTFVTEETS